MIVLMERLLMKLLF